MTNKELRTYLNHGIGSRRIKIKRDGSIVAFGSAHSDTDRSMDFWQWVGYREDIERQARIEKTMT
jgi:hypothetical protein